MTLRTPQQERWAIWAEKMRGKIESGDPFELPIHYANAAQRVVGRSIEEIALSHNYLRHSPAGGKVRFVHRGPSFNWEPGSEETGGQTPEKHPA